MVCRDATRKAAVHLELSLARDIKNNKKGFSKYMSSKRKIRGNVGLLLNPVDVLGMEDTENMKLLSTFFASVFTAESSPQESHTLEVRGEGWRKENFSLVAES